MPLIIRISIILCLVGSHWALAQALLNKGTTVYVDGVPQVAYKGEVCSQTKTQISSDGRADIWATCYDNSFNPARQCSFRWYSSTKQSEFSIATYNHYEDRDAKVSRQSNFSIAEFQIPSLVVAAAIGSQMMEKYCGAETLNEMVRYHYHWSNYENNMICVYTERHDEGKPIDQIESQCFRNNFTLQCGVHIDVAEWIGNNFNGKAEYAITDYRKTGNVRSQTTRESKKAPISTSREAAKALAHEWLVENCE